MQLLPCIAHARNVSKVPQFFTCSCSFPMQTNKILVFVIVVTLDISGLSSYANSVFSLEDHRARLVDEEEIPMDMDHEGDVLQEKLSESDRIRDTKRLFGGSSVLKDKDPCKNNLFGDDEECDHGKGYLKPDTSKCHRSAPGYVILPDHVLFKNMYFLLIFRKLTIFPLLISYACLLTVSYTAAKLHE